LVQYQYWHIPLPELAFKNDARTGIGIVALWFITGMGIVRYWYWYLILPVPVLAFLHLGSVLVQAQSITHIGIQNWCPYRYWHFCTLVQYQYGHIPLPGLGFINGSSTGIGIFVLWFIISIGAGHYWWAPGAPQQLAISMVPCGAILLVRFELIASRSLC
jgi:hypothetical protein